MNKGKCCANCMFNYGSKTARYVICQKVESGKNDVVRSTDICGKFVPENGKHILIKQRKPIITRRGRPGSIDWLGLTETEKKNDKAHEQDSV